MKPAAIDVMQCTHIYARACSLVIGCNKYVLTFDTREITPRVWHDLLHLDADVWEDIGHSILTYSAVEHTISLRVKTRAVKYSVQLDKTHRHILKKIIMQHVSDMSGKI